jgi:hypothetical protein
MTWASATYHNELFDTACFYFIIIWCGIVEPLRQRKGKR